MSDPTPTSSEISEPLLTVPALSPSQGPTDPQSCPERACPELVEGVEGSEIENAPTPLPPILDPQSEISNSPDDLHASLPPHKLTALQCIYRGATFPDAANGAGVTPRTIYRWIESDHVFAALYHAWERQSLRSGRARALAAVDAAMDTVLAAIARGDSRAAFQLIKQLGVLTPKTPGHTDPEELRRRQAIRQTRKNQRLAATEQKLGLHIPQVPRTLAEVEAAMGPLGHLRDQMIHKTEERWCHYLTYKHLTEQQYAKNYSARQYPYGPPAEPRPSWRQFFASLERLAEHHHWDLKAFVSQHARERRKAAQIARSHSQPPSQSTASPIGNRQSAIGNLPTSPSPDSAISNQQSAMISPSPPPPYTEPESDFIPYNPDLDSIERNRW